MNHFKLTWPSALSCALLTFVWVEVAANFSFHWVTAGDLGNGLSLPSTFHLVIPAAFVSWAMFFAAGADRSAFVKVSASSTLGAVGALLLMFLTTKTGGMPDFWGIALFGAIIAFGAVLISSIGDWYFVPAAFSGFASVLFWWFATGLDGWAPGGGGAANSLQSLADPATAGAGAFGGILSTPYLWVFVNTAVTLVIGCLLGALSVRIAATLSAIGAVGSQPSKVG